MFKKIIISLAVLLFSASSVYADRRSYVWTYEYITMPKGQFEVEYYLTNEIADLNKSNINKYKHWLEIEYGITDRWDISLYQMFRQTNGKTESRTEYDGFKIRTRYRFFEKNQFIVDPLIYLEYIRDGDFRKPNVIEAKLILAKDISNFNISYNQIVKRDLESRGKTKAEYAVGLNYEFSPKFKFGIESKGNYSERKYALGPTLAFAHKNFWVNLGSAFGINKRTDDVQIRMIVGIPF